MSSFHLYTPKTIATDLAEKVKALRLQANWTQQTLAERSGVSLGSLRRFEQKGQISLDALLLLVSALGRLNDFTVLLNPPQVNSLKALEARAKTRQRGRI